MRWYRKYIRGYQSLQYRIHCIYIELEMNLISNGTAHARFRAPPVIFFNRLLRTPLRARRSINTLLSLRLLSGSTTYDSFLVICCRDFLFLASAAPLSFNHYFALAQPRFFRTSSTTIYRDRLLLSFNLSQRINRPVAIRSKLRVHSQDSFFTAINI